MHPIKTQSRWRICGASMALLTITFSGRVAGQAVQRWYPQPWLPPFEAWQGSHIPYPVLLALQLSILGLMAWTSIKAFNGMLVSGRGAMQWLAFLGGLYMALALVRIGIGIAVVDAHPWFTAWIPGVFHVVLAAFVLSLAGYHSLRGKVQGGAKP